MEFDIDELKIGSIRKAAKETLKNSNMVKIWMESPVAFTISIGLVLILLSLICGCCCRGNKRYVKAPRRKNNNATISSTVKDSKYILLETWNSELTNRS
ncbi:hypothetical protein RND71_023583 [Anisodus tanguticus]|uniref:Uncharacterized protein n=1 Tax=Anisodus tanguticus TaxID=243964 RepID=A0AAE1RU64_9SOLA|nr:hypothetical protein RND71_023583 [Anisodus tanguticus]